jgi:predicted porin
MKKSLVALAAVAVTGAAFAQSTVTLFGTFDPSYQNIATTYGGGAKSTQNTVGNDARGTSQISVRGVEDLGGGLKAQFLYEGDFHVGSSTGTVAPGGTSAGLHAIGSRGGEIYAGVMGGFGDLKIGTPNTPSLSVQGGRSPIGTKIGSGFNSTSGTSHVRENSSIVYRSPAMAGFTVAVGYAFKAGANASSTPGQQAVAGITPAAAQGSKSDIGLFYAGGPIRAGVTFFEQDATATVAGKNKQTNIYAQYDFAGSTAYVGFHDEKLTSGAKSDGYNVAIKYALTPAMYLIGNYASLNDKAAANADKTILALGGEYVLSKRSTVYARYVEEKNDNVTLTTAIKGVKTTLIGLQHNF